MLQDEMRRVYDSARGLGRAESSETEKEQRRVGDEGKSGKFEASNNNGAMAAQERTRETILDNK